MLTPKGRNDSHKFDYSQITDQIYIGSDFCKGGVCLLHGEEFKKLGIQIEINLSQENNELPPKDMGVGYVWLPVADGYAPSLAQLSIGTSVMHEAINAGKKVYIHCRNGHGRSPTLIAAYLIRHKKMSLEEALKLIYEKRPESHVEDSQLKGLENFSRDSLS